MSRWQWFYGAMRRQHAAATAVGVAAAGGAATMTARATTEPSQLTDLIGRVQPTAGCDGGMSIDLTVNDRFRGLAVQHNVMLKAVALGIGKRGRGLFTTAALREDDLVARVPLEHCLVHMKGESPQEDQDWPFWLASRLLQALAAPTGLWAKYKAADFLPTEAEAASDLPSARSTAWLEKYSHWPLVNKLRLHREQTEWLYKSVTERSDVPAALLWAQALVLSRSFGLSASNELIGMIPFLDMLNHSERPNTKLHVDERRGQIYAYALTDIAPGEELVITYADGGVPNAALLMKYGFALENNATHLMLLTDSEARFLLDPNLLMAHLDGTDAKWESKVTPELRAVLQALPVSSKGSKTPEEEHAIATGLLAELTKRLARVETDATEPDLGPLSLLLPEELALLRSAVEFLKGYLKTLE